MLKFVRNRLYIVPVLMHTLDILEFLSKAGAPIKMYEISNTTGIPPTTTYRILQTLVHRGYLAHDLEGKYSLVNPPGMMTVFRTPLSTTSAAASVA